MSHPLTVVIPTYNRRDALQQCLEHLEAQTRKDFEVVIVDDGSTDDTAAWVQNYVRLTPLSVRYVSQQNRGPARARNFAISLVQSPITVLIGDDIFATPHFTAEHMQLHEQQPDMAVVGVGLTRWAEMGQTVTPFMRWLDTDGMQFNYGELVAGKAPDWTHFYTSNLSVKTELLRRFSFDESFPYAAMEDIEVAARIEAQHGLTMVFLPEAVAYHLHPLSFAQACRRMEKVGESMAHFNHLCPGKLPRGQNPWAAKLERLLDRIPFAQPLVERLASFSLKFSCPNRLMRFVLAWSHDRGYDRYALEKRPAANLS